VRFAAMDIECTSLDASYGRLICVCFKFFDEDEVRSRSIRWVRQEPALLDWVVQQYSQVGVLVTHNGRAFDFAYINARLMQHGMPPLEPIKHVDLLYQAKKLRTRGSSLDATAKDLKFKYQKYEVPAWRWVLAAEGDKESIAEIVKHCEQDVRMTQEEFERLEPLIVRITR